MPDKSSSFQQLSPDEQAGYWLALLDSPLADAGRRLEFKNWLEQSENLKAWQNMLAFQNRLQQITPGQVEQLESSISLLAGVPQSSAVVKQALPNKLIRSRILPVAACVVIAVMVNFVRQSGYFADFRTQRGEQQLITLDDGSKVLLNTASALSVEFDGTARKLMLYRGEAHFEVTPDAGRPFTVHTPKASVTALGTVFDIKDTGDASTVTVFEHAVRVEFVDGAPIERLNTGEQAVYRNAQATINSAVNLNHAGAWQSHRLIFANRPLGEVIAELSRYRGGHILIFDKTLSAHQVSGVFDSNDPEAALSTIVNSLPITQYRLTSNFVVLSPQN